MKKWSVIFLLTVYVFSSTEFSEILKTPFLISHYLEHQTVNSDIGFGEFLYIHYVNHPKGKKGFEGNDSEKDSKLPFRSHADCNSFASIYVMPDSKLKLPEQIFIIEQEEAKIFYSNQSLRSFYTPSIWQPPKLG